MNDRKCFQENLPLSVEYYRIFLMTDMMNWTLNDQNWNIYSKSDWQAGWKELMKSGVYERGKFGDLMLFGIACGIRKMLLILHKLGLSS